MIPSSAHDRFCTGGRLECALAINYEDYIPGVR